MKKQLLLILHCLLLSHQLHAASPQATAPSPKIGYTNLDYLINSLPETPQVESTLKSFEKQLQQRLYTAAGKLQQKQLAYQQGHETMTEAAKKQKIAELQQLEVSLNQMQQDLGQQFLAKREKLYQPLYEKVQAAIQQVKKANSYTFIFNARIGDATILLAADEEYDVTGLVLKHLGITPPKEKAPDSQPTSKAKKKKGKKK